MKKKKVGGKKIDEWNLLSMTICQMTEITFKKYIFFMCYLSEKEAK